MSSLIKGTEMKENELKKYSRESIDTVIRLLKKPDLTMKEIAEITNSDFYYISDINRGKITDLNYPSSIFPIRSIDNRLLNADTINNIISLLKNTTFSIEQIGNMTGVSSFIVGQINRGKHKECKNLQDSFPIRDKQTKLSTNEDNLKVSEVIDIIDAILHTTLSFEEIARRYTVEKSAIDRINRKETWKNVSEKYQAPIRTNPYNKQFRS